MNDRPKIESKESCGEANESSSAWIGLIQKQVGSLKFDAVRITAFGAHQGRFDCLNWFAFSSAVEAILLTKTGCADFFMVLLTQQQST